MGLVKFELGKVFRNRRVRVLVLVLLILNPPLLFWNIRSRYDYVLDSKPEYESLLEEYAGMDLAASQRELTERAEQAREFSQLESARQSGNTALLDILQEQSPNLAGDYMASYPDYIAGMEDQAEQMRRASIFNKPGTFSYRNVQKTPEDFRKNRGLTLKFGSSAGLEALSRFFLTDVLVLFLTLLFAVRLFREEREKGLLPLVRSTALAKLLTRLNGGELFRQELRKLAFSRKMAVLLLALGLFIGQSVQKTEPVYAFDDGVYQSYVDTLEGELTPEKERFLQEEEQRFQTTGERRLALRQDLDDGKNTPNQYEYGIFELDNFEAKQTGFSRVWDQYQRLLDLRDRGIRAGFVSELSEDYVFSRPERDAALGMLALALTLTAASATFCQEYRGGMIQILNPTKNGKGRLFAAKLGAVALFALCFFLVGLPQYLNGRRYYSLGDLTLPVQNLERFAGTPGKISILTYLLLWQGAKLLTLGAGLALAVWFAVRFRSQAPALLAGLGVAELPPVLYLCRVSGAKFLPFAGGFLLSQGTGNRGEVLGSLAGLILTAALGLGLGTAAYQTFCNRRRKHHGA